MDRGLKIKTMKKPLLERFQQLAGIKPLHVHEQDDFTPDLEDDELKRGKIQQMMAKEKGPLKSNIDQTWESYEIMTDDLIQFIQMQYDANGSDIMEDWNDLIIKMQEKLKSLGGDDEDTEYNV